MGYIYQLSPQNIPDDVQAQLAMLSFRVDDNMDLIASWDDDGDNPFSYYINSECELILGVQ